MRQTIYTVGDWLDARNLSEAGKVNYEITLRKFFQSINPDLEKADIDDFSREYIVGVKEGIIDLDNDLLRFNWGRGTSPKTNFSRIKSYFKWNDITIREHIAKEITAGSRRMRKPYRVKREEIQAILDQLDLPYKALTLVLISSGARIGEVMKFRLSSINWRHDPIKINQTLQSNRRKGRADYVFITPEAGEYLKRWIDQRDELMHQMRAKVNMEYDPDNDLVFPFAKRTYGNILRAVRRKLGLNEGVSPHSFRRYFRTARWKNSDIPKALMGHKDGVDAVYNLIDQDPDYLAREYKENILNLTIFDEWRDNIELELERDKAVRDKLKLVTEVEEEKSYRIYSTGQMKSRIIELENKLANLTEYIRKDSDHLMDKILDN